MLKSGRNILTRLLPKTGQTVCYAAGDDGAYEAGWWKGRLNSNNRTRWTPKTISGDDIVLDRATGLMWAADGNAAGCANGGVGIWGGALIYADGLTFAGFSDWRLPNVLELLSIVHFGKNAPTIDETLFPNTISDAYWTSTVYHIINTYAWAVRFEAGFHSTKLRTDSFYTRCVRKGL